MAEVWICNQYNFEHLEEIEEPSAKNTNVLLVSSPTHLNRIPERLPEASIKNISTIFCSGAPLSLKSSITAKDIFGCSVTEVYGSTETGGIAWQEQDKHISAVWQVMPCVELRKNRHGCLDVRSPHLSNPDAWFSTSDVVTFDSNESFSLLGRIDRIVKVEGKRISLDEIESHLLKLNIVADVSLVLLEGRRTEIGAVIVLTDEAREQLESQGKRSFNQQFKDHLIQYIERPLLPRRWRYINNLPINSQGKLSQQALLNLFSSLSISTSINDASEKNASRPLLPITRTQSQIGSLHYNLILFIPKELLYFDGHFDKTPILAGVVQVHWAEHYAQQLFTIKGDFVRLEAVKFQKIILAESELTLEITYNSEKNKVSFSYSSSIGQHSSGRIVYSE